MKPETKVFKVRFSRAWFSFALSILFSFNVLARPLLNPDPAGCAVRIAELSENQAIRGTELLGRFGKFRIEAMVRQIGFSMHHKEVWDGRLEQVAIVTSPHLDIDLPRRQIWEYNGQKYEFLSLGLINLAPYSTLVNERIVDHLVNRPDDNLVIVFDSKRIQEGYILRKLRYAVHSAVLDVYKQEKPYLNDRDFRILKHSNMLSGNSDVFALVKYKEGGIKSVKELEENLIMAVQNSYYGNHTYITPNDRSVLAAAHINIFSSDDLLPFEYRIPAEAREGYRQLVYSKFNPASTAEVLRYVNFDPKIPPAIRAKFNLYTFDAGVIRGAENFLAVGATDTSGLFKKRYNFRTFGLLPVVQNLEPEYLNYLRVHSRRYENLRDKLVDKSRNVIVTEVGVHDSK